MWWTWGRRNVTEMKGKGMAEWVGGKVFWQYLASPRTRTKPRRADISYVDDRLAETSSIEGKQMKAEILSGKSSSVLSLHKNRNHQAMKRYQVWHTQRSHQWNDEEHPTEIGEEGISGFRLNTPESYGYCGATWYTENNTCQLIRRN